MRWVCQIRHRRKCRIYYMCCISRKCCPTLLLTFSICTGNCVRAVSHIVLSSTGFIICELILMRHVVIVFVTIHNSYTTMIEVICFDLCVASALFWSITSFTYISIAFSILLRLDNFAFCITLHISASVMSCLQLQQLRRYVNTFACLDCVT